MDFWDLTIRFFSLTDANVRHVLAGSVLLGGAAGGLGCFAYLQKRSLIGDALAHAALPGVALAFIVVGQKELLWLLLGAAATGWLGAISVNLIARYSRIKPDAALGIVLSVFFGLGIVLLTSIQKSGSGSLAGLDKFLFGQASAMAAEDVRILAVVGLSMLGAVFVFFPRLKLVAFDPEAARVLGIRVGWWEFFITTMIVFSVTIGLQAVGVVLMAALLITPAASARQWTDRLPTMIIFASVFGMIAGLVGAYVSFLAPRFPTGPWIVVAVSVIFGISLLFAPGRGVVSRMRQLWMSRGKMTREHILKVLFRSGQTAGEYQVRYSMKQIGRMWSFDARGLRRGLAQLVRSGALDKEVDGFTLTESGMIEGARVLRLHRLWEVYLTRFLDLPQDHVHRDAEEMEHIITPEIEAQLEGLLDQPEFDPHRQEIPYIGRKDTT
ncbi:MAG: iron chelate uptake ABC transporter family permease subunit [Candidatus Zixiibacteriota bacterium]